MASSYVLPSPTLPHAHRDHTHSHSHTRSQSQTSLNALRMTISNNSLPSLPDDEAYSHNHSRDHSHDHSHDYGHGDPNGHSHHHSGHAHGRTSSHMSNTGALVSREKAAPPALNTMEGWTQEKTAGGKNIVTPGLNSAQFLYSPPDHHHHGHDNHGHSHSNSHDHDHNHGQSYAHPQMHDHENDTNRSWFTRMILPYTSRFPILHAIVIEKDSRRIFYFMAYVLSVTHVLH